MGLPPSTTPAATVESLTKGLEHSLDLKSATQGDRVVNTEVGVVVRNVGASHVVEVVWV